jgi:hypothetical protein
VRAVPSAQGAQQKKGRARVHRAPLPPAPQPSLKYPRLFSDRSTWDFRLGGPPPASFSLKPRYSARVCVFRSQTASLELRMRLVKAGRRGRQDPDIAAGSLRMPRKVLGPACFVCGINSHIQSQNRHHFEGYYDE